MKRKILHVVYSLDIGGLERVIISLFNRIDSNRYEPHICCITRGGELAPLLNDRERMYVVGHTGRISISSVTKVYRVIRRHGIDLIHSHNLPGLLYGFPAARLHRVPMVHTQHGRILRERSSVLNAVEKYLSRSVNRYVCVSAQLGEVVRKAFDINEDRLSVIYNGIDVPGDSTAPSGERGENITIGSIGRLDPIKNYSMLVEAFSVILKRFPRCRLEIVGGGECYDDLAERIDALSLAGNASLPGYQMDVYKHLQRYDIFVLPSFSEGHSISLLEALGTGKICIASRVGGNPEIITDGMNGLLFDPHSIGELIEKLSLAIEKHDRPEMDAIRMKARETVLSNYSSAIMLARYEQMYRELLGD